MELGLGQTHPVGMQLFGDPPGPTGQWAWDARGRKKPNDKVCLDYQTTSEMMHIEAVLLD